MSVIADPVAETSDRLAVSSAGGAAGGDRTAHEASLRRVIRAAGQLASFCEHVEHNELSSIADARGAGAVLREVAQALSAERGIALVDAYEERIRGVEAASLLCEDDLVGAELLVNARTWRELQEAQLVHDRQYHPDVFGLSKLDQVRHYTFHVTKLVALMADAIDTETWHEFEGKRLPDLAIFGVKIATVCNERLPETPVDASD